MKKFPKLFIAVLMLLVVSAALVACSENSANNTTVTSISISGSDTAAINVGEQYTAIISPDNATNQSVTWEVISGTATINQSGLLTATAVCTVTIKATADGKSATKEIIVSNPSELENPTDPLKAAFIGFETVDATTYKVKVSNDTESLNIVDVATVESTWKLTTDMQATNEIPSKIATPLVVGDNTFYVLVSADNSVRLYTLHIRRLPVYQVSFETSGGSAVETQNIEEGGFAPLPTEPTKTGYTFASWDKDFDTPITENTSFTANWQVITYNITYHLDGGTNGDNPKTYNIETAIINLEKPTRIGYNGTWDIDTIVEGSVGNKIITAIWTPIAYTITFENLLNGTNSNSQKNYTIETDTIVFSNPTRPGYSGSWDITTIVKGSIGNKTISAIWTPITYNITYYPDSEQVNNPATYTIETPTFTLSNTTKKEGYTFDGWYTESSFQTKKISITKGSIGNIELYAKWLKNGLTFALNTNGSSYEITGYIGDEAQINIPNEYAGLPVTVIHTSAFYNNKSLSSIVIPENITTIGREAFKNCTNLISIDFNAANCADFAYPNQAFYYAGTNTSGITVTIGKNVTRIPAFIFHNSEYTTLAPRMPKITAVNFEQESVCSAIGERAFCSTNIARITIPESVTDIGSYAFAYCRDLTIINFNAINCSVPDSGGYARFIFDSAGYQWVVGIGYVAVEVFLIVGAEVTRIPTNMFSGESLVVVFYGGADEAEWNQITIDNYNAVLIAAERYYYSANPIFDGQHWHFNTDGLTPVIWIE